MSTPRAIPRVTVMGALLCTLTLVAPTTASAAGWTLSTEPISGPVALAPGCSDDADENAPQIAVNPRNPADLAATYAIGDGTASVLARSDNAGVSWTRSPIAGTLSCNGGGGTWEYRFDPDLGFDPYGRLYISESVQAAGDASGTAGVDDLLLTAAPGSDALSGPEPLVSADRLAGAQRGFLAFPSSRPGGVDVLTERLNYVAGQYAPVGGSLQIAESSDGGNALVVHTVDTAPPDESIVAEGLVQFGQTLLAFGEEISASQFPALVGLASSAQEQAIVARSDNGGVTWSAPRVVFTHDVGSDGVTGCCLSRPVAAPDGTIYWADDSSGQLSLYRSTDAGETWSVQSLPGVGDVSEPTVAAGAGGRVMVAFYQLSAGGQSAAPRIEVSGDHGISWQALSVGTTTQLSALGPVDDTSQLGPVQGAGATPTGFVAAMTVGGSLVTAGGGSDVDLITVKAPAASARRSTARHRRRPTQDRQLSKPRPARSSA